MQQWNPPIVLASRSPRRKEILSQITDAIVVHVPCDDGLFERGSISIERWVQTLAIVKAQSVHREITQTRGTILAADTVCAVDGKLYGQPKTVSEARQMLTSMMGRAHEVLTGWCLLSVDGSQMQSGVEKASVEIGCFEGEKLENHLQNREWEGKAGGYNYADSLSLGWPLRLEGEMEIVMGLPKEKLQQLLKQQN